MRQKIAAIALPILLAACATYPAGDQYGPGSPYPPQQNGYYLPPPYEDPNLPPTSGSEPCPIRGSGDWRAWVNAMPGPNEGPTLHVTGKVTTPTGGYIVEFTPYLQDVAGRPGEKIAQVRAIPPQGFATQAVVTHDLKWQWPLTGPQVTSVTIRCADKQLATLPVQTAY